MPIIAVVGSRKSGKTTAVEALVKGFTGKGYTIATVKHISEPDFTMDTEGKDTWRHTKAGARVTLSVAPSELTLIKKADTAKYGLTDIVKHCEDEADIIILEGFRDLVAQNPLVPKVVAVKTAEEVKEASQYFKPIVAFSGALSTVPKGLRIPYFDALQKPEKLVETVENKIKPMIRKEKKLKAPIRITVNGKRLPLNLFVQKFTRAVVLSMVSTLRDVSVEGDENVFLTIKSPSK